MKGTLLVESRWTKPFWGAIGLYIASIVVWAIISYVLLIMDLQDPVRIVAMLWALTYPITLVIGPVCALVARCAQQWHAYIHALLLPLYATILAIVLAGIVGGYDQLEKYWARGAFWSDPPTHISELKPGVTFEDATEEQLFTNVFFLPDGVTESDINKWDGKSLFFKTTMLPDAVEDFYAHAYAAIGFTPYGGGCASAGCTYSKLDYDLSEQAHFAVLISTEENQTFTQVGIVTCYARVDCWQPEWNQWEKNFK